MQHILIIGGSDAGVSAALRVKELAAQTAVSVIVADSYPGFSICGLPFFLSGEVGDWHSLAHHTINDLEEIGIQLFTNCRAETISPTSKSVHVVSNGGNVKDIKYDKLLIATGADSARPPIAGLDQDGIFQLRWMEDGFRIHDFIERKKPQHCVIIGGGYIGLEMADALAHRGLEITVLEFLPEVLSTLDPAIGRLIRNELVYRGVKVNIGWAVKSINPDNGRLLIKSASGDAILTDTVLVATGVRPATKLAETAGISLGVAGAIQVDQMMATNIPDIFAAGDCAETWHKLLQNKVYMPLGTTAHKQGRIAGENMAGGNSKFKGTLGTQVVKVFDKIAAGTGLRDLQALRAGFNPLTTNLITADHNPYYPGVQEITISITGDRNTGRLLGAQIVGHHTSEIAKRIDVIAAALYDELLVENLCDIDLSYSPPLSSPWDPLQKAAMQWNREQHTEFTHN